ncbi:MAG: hypothetical protein JWO00_424 [Candidatus Parcubacteria bacterium]|nr:hypothetical protein [Candidatus Parcubacteria bacterium]
MNPPRETIAYVTRDIERALGMEPQEGYFVIANRTAYAESIQKQYPRNVILIDSPTGELLGTGDLLKHEKTLDFLANHRDSAGTSPKLLVFKNSALIEPVASERGWKLLNPPAALAEKIENKISQIEWLGGLSKYLPFHHVELMKDVRWNGEPLVVQWAHGHTGGGTILVRTGAELAALKEKFPERRSRVTAFINGPSLTVNVVVGADAILAGNINYQITGMAPFTGNAFATVGNDWKLAHTILTDADKQAIASLIHDIGARMQKDSWRGLFGLDFMKDSVTGRIYLIEINARQPASTTYESQLQRIRRAEGASGMTTFEAHIAALTGQPLSQPIIALTDGAQIIQRVTGDISSISDETIGSLELSGFEVMAYPNTEENSDLIRIQSATGIMAEHGVFNETGQEIRDTILQ